MSAEATDPTTRDFGDETVSRLAAIVFDRDEAPDEALIAFVDGAISRGARVAGLVQERADDELSELHDVRVCDLVSGEILPIMQDLGAGAAAPSIRPRSRRPLRRRGRPAAAGEPGGDRSLVAGGGVPRVSVGDVADCPRA